MKLHELIKKKRKEMELKKISLAVYMDVSVTTVYNWEKGVMAPRGGNRERLFALLGIEETDIINND